MRMIVSTSPSSYLLAFSPSVISVCRSHSGAHSGFSTVLSLKQPSGKLEISSVNLRKNISFQDQLDSEVTNFSRRSRISSLSPRMAAITDPVEILVKAATGEPDKLGDCPFCHRVLLTLEEKKLPYKTVLIDTSNKPAWFLEANPEGKVPVIKHEGAWLADSDVITQVLEKQHPKPSLLTPEEKLSVGSKLFPSFVKFLKSKESNDGTEEALVAELTALNEHLKTAGPFVNGDKVSAVDLSLAPKLYHLHTTLANFKNWSIPENLTYVHDYIKALESRESFKNTAAPPEVVVRGWEAHIA